MISLNLNSKFTSYRTQLLICLVTCLILIGTVLVNEDNWYQEKKSHTKLGVVFTETV